MNSKRITVAALLLFVIGFCLFLVGPQYEIHKILSEGRARMADFDWIGVEWIAAGMLCMTRQRRVLADSIHVEQE